MKGVLELDDGRRVFYVDRSPLDWPAPDENDGPADDSHPVLIKREVIDALGQSRGSAGLLPCVRRARTDDTDITMTTTQVLGLHPSGP